MRIIYFLPLIFIFLVSCTNNETKEGENIVLANGTMDDSYINEMGITLGNPLGTLLNEAIIRDLPDDLYPDNPDIEGRSEKWNKYEHSKVVFNRKEGTNLFDLMVYPANDQSDTIIFKEIDLMELIPSTPEWIREHDYINKISIINQEWNRQQVKFESGFELKGNGTEKDQTVRIDLARNCLNSYLWELISYTREDGKQKSMYHGWFDFPHETYDELFEERTGVEFSTYKEHLKDWKAPESERIDFGLLRTLDSEIEATWTSHNDEYYPLVGARKSKFKNIIVPAEPTVINHFLTDETVFSTFYPPGCYSRAFPRETTLGRMAVVKNIKVRNMTSLNPGKDQGVEFDFTFSRAEDSTITTKMIVGGVDLSKIPTRSMTETHKGYKMPMGIGNHSFYETYDEMIHNPTPSNPFYAILIDENEKFIDSHGFGIDGPLMHWDESDSSLLHFWVLSFERHALVGHYTIQFPIEQ